MKKYPYPIKAVIFDNDGVILDTLPLYYEALAKLVPPPYPPEVIAKVNGRSDLEVSAIFVKEFNLSCTPEEFHQKRTKYLQELFPHSQLIPGVDLVIKKIYEMGIPLGVATGSVREIHELKMLAQPEIYKLFNYILCGDEVKKAKPSPDIFQAVSAHLGNFDPKNVLVFEDAFNGIKAANSAGMPCVLLHRPIEERKTDGLGHISAEEGLAKVGAFATQIIPNFSQFNFDDFDWDISK